MITAREVVPGQADADAVEGVVTEIFCSIQGEGIYAGERQVFVRTAGCSATCYWCDTVSSKRERPVCLVHGENRRSLPNPVTVGAVADVASTLAVEQGPARTVSVTGGEPLEQPGFVTALGLRLRDRGFRIYLETSGLEPRAMLEVRSSVDVVAMDVKLPSATGQEHWTAHRQFLNATVGLERFVKIVVDATTPLAEVQKALRLIADADPSIPVVLQPESRTFLKSASGADARARLVRILEAAQRDGSRYVDDVRILPQLHKVLKVR